MSYLQFLEHLTLTAFVIGYIGRSVASTWMDVKNILKTGKH